jgi:hypothetical protein
MIRHDYRCDNDECGHIERDVLVPSDPKQRVRPVHCGRPMYEYFGENLAQSVQEFVPFTTRNIHPDGKELLVRNKGDLQRYYREYGVVHVDDPGLVAEGNQIVRKGARMGTVFDMGGRR